MPRALFRALLLAALLLPGAASAQEEPLSSDWLELVKGYKDANMGAELVSIEAGDTPDTRKITLAIPRESIGDRQDIEEVIVVGRRPESPEFSFPIEIEYEWLDDYDNDRYGLVIHLGRDSDWPIRLYMNSAPGFTR